MSSSRTCTSVKGLCTATVMFLLLATTGDGWATLITADAHTVILDHFDGTTDGTSFGPLAFQSSLAGHGQAGQFETGNYVKYSLPNLGPEGTIEMFVKPFADPGNADLLGFQWFDSATPPTFGYIMHLGFTADDHVRYSVCCAPNAGFQSISAIPVDEWTYLAISWGALGSKLYVDGQIEAITSTNLRPEMLSNNFAYLNYWGGIAGVIHDPLEFHGLVDDLHISNIQRSDAEILAHAEQIPESSSMVMIFTGLLLLTARQVLRAKSA